MQLPRLARWRMSVQNRFPVQLTMSRIGNHTRLMPNLLKVMIIHTSMYIYHTCICIYLVTTGLCIYSCIYVSVVYPFLEIRKLCIGMINDLGVITQTTSIYLESLVDIDIVRELCIRIHTSIEHNRQITLGRITSLCISGLSIIAPSQQLAATSR